MKICEKVFWKYLVSFFISKEIAYSSSIRNFYAQKITTNEAYERLSELAWYREPDECTKYLINKARPGSYTSAETITSITIPKGVNIVNGMFSGCTNLVSVKTPKSITTIGDYAFSDCTSLASITIPDSVTIIGKYAFYGCPNIKEVYFNSEAQMNKFKDLPYFKNAKL